MITMPSPTPTEIGEQDTRSQSRVSQHERYGLSHDETVVFCLFDPLALQKAESTACVSLPATIRRLINKRPTATHTWQENAYSGVTYYQVL